MGSETPLPRFLILIVGEELFVGALTTTTSVGSPIGEPRSGKVACTPGLVCPAEPSSVPLVPDVVDHRRIVVKGSCGRFTVLPGAGAILAANHVPPGSRGGCDMR